MATDVVPTRPVCQQGEFLYPKLLGLLIRAGIPAENVKDLACVLECLAAVVALHETDHLRGDLALVLQPADLPKAASSAVQHPKPMIAQRTCKLANRPSVTSVCASTSFFCTSWNDASGRLN